MAAGWVAANVSESQIIGKQDSAQLLGFYEHLAVRGPAQAEVLDSYNIKAKIAEKLDGLLVGALIDEESGRHLSSLTDRVDLFLLHELLGIANTGEDVLLGEVRIALGDNLLGSETIGQEPEDDLHRYAGPSDPRFSMTHVGADLDPVSDLHRDHLAIIAMPLYLDIQALADANLEVDSR